MSGADTSMSTNSAANSRADGHSACVDSRGPNETPAPDPCELRQQGQLFRALMDTPMTAGQLADWAKTRDSDPDTAFCWTSRGDADTRQDLADRPRDAPIDVSAMLQARHLIDAGPSALSSALPTSPPDSSLAELIEKHVRRVLASVDTRGSLDDEVRIELSDAVFPGTELSLKRTPQGWQLTATANNRRSLDKLHHFAPALIERFARASLGELTLVTPPGALRF